MKFYNKMIIIWIVFTTSVYGHPVPYKDAVGVMTWNQPFLTDSWITYSFRPDTAIAARYMRMEMEDGESKLYMPQLNYLLKRWNEKDSQANIYLYGGAGALHFKNQTGSAGLIGVEADAEDRKYFILGKLESMYGSIGENFHSATLRVGIAPYEAEYDEVASWFMLQAQSHPALTKSFALTPLARFFYKSALFEIGVSLDGDWMINLMFHI